MIILNTINVGEKIESGDLVQDEYDGKIYWIVERFDYLKEKTTWCLIDLVNNELKVEYDDFNKMIDEYSLRTYSKKGNFAIEIRQ